jgi:hypothetical protein
MVIKTLTKLTMGVCKHLSGIRSGVRLHVGYSFEMVKCRRVWGNKNSPVLVNFWKKG